MTLIYFSVLTGVLGLAIGSFLNVVILRSLTEQSLKGRSACPGCSHQLGALDLIPVFSYLLLKGKCRYCHKSISRQYPLIEAVTALLFFFTAYLVFSRFNGALNLHSISILAIYLLGISVLLAVFVTDLKKGLIPNRIIIPGILLLLAFKMLFLVSIMGSIYFTLLGDPAGVGKYLLPPYSGYIFTLLGRHLQALGLDLLAAFIIGLVFYSLIVFTKGRALGGGDIKLGFFIGLLNGWPLSLVALMIAFISGAMVGVGLIIFGQKKFGQTIPFGPFLVLGSVIALFWGQGVFDWYLGLLG